MSEARSPTHAPEPGRTILRVLLVAGLAVLSACGTAPDKPSDEARKPLYWPGEPDPPRYVFEATLRSVADITVDTEADRFRRLATGAGAPTTPVLDKPSAIAAHKGRIYVGDTVKRSVVVFDVPRRKVFEFGLRSPGRLAKPISLAVDEQQRVYVADATQRQVLVYDGLGLYLKAIGGPADLVHPSGVAVNASGDRVYVVDRGSNENDAHRVLIYDGAGNKLKTVGQRGGKPGEFNVPVEAAVAPDGTLYVLDAGNFRVQAFDREGTPLRAFGKTGSGLGQFARPRGIAVDRQGNVYVTDGSFGNCQVFDRDGNLLLAIGRSGAVDSPGVYRLPIGVTVDETNRVYVVDQFFRKVEVIRKLGEEEIRALAP